MADEDLWKSRFHVFMGIRFTGLLVFFAGTAIAFTDLVRDGGWPALGAVIATLGVIDAVFAPRLLKAHWDREDKATGR
jgi:hypothetical protein